MTKHHLLAFVAGILAIGGCSPKTQPAAKIDTAPQVVPIPANNFAVQWKAELPLQGGQIKRIVAWDQFVFALSTDNVWYWISRSSGRLVTILRAAEPMERAFAPMMIGDRVYFPAGTRIKVYNLRGEKQDEIPLAYSISSDGMGVEQIVYIGIDHQNGGRIAAIPVKQRVFQGNYNLTPIWEVMTRSQLSAAPAIQAGNLYFGGRDGNVYAVRAQTALVLWPGRGGHFSTNGTILADIKADKDGVYIASADSKLYCLDLNDGHQIWCWYAGHALDETSTPVVTSNFVYLHAPHVGVAAIDKGAKQEIRPAKWIIPDGRQVLSLDERNIYVASKDGSILAADRQTGKVLYRSARDGYACFASCTGLSDGMVFAADADGAILAVRPVNRGAAVGEMASVR